MVKWKRHKWIDEHGPQERCLDPGRQKKRAYFGYRKVPADDKAKWVLRHFDTVASKYDFMNTLLSFGIHHRWKRTAVDMLGLRAGDRVVDVCGGTGDLSILAAKGVGLSGKVMLYDMNRAMLEAGRPKVSRSSSAPNIFYVQGDAERLSFPVECFDAAMVGFGVRNLTHIERGFAEMYRVLKPGGKIMCLEFSKPTAPLFRWLYDLYSFYVMPLLGELIVGSREAYTHLPESIRTFLLPDELTAIMVKVGFSHISHRKFSNGIAVVHLGKKGEALR